MKSHSTWRIVHHKRNTAKGVLLAKLNVRIDQPKHKSASNYKWDSPLGNAHATQEEKGEIVISSKNFDSKFAGKCSLVLTQAHYETCQL